ncbi:hypothetical protein TNCV_5059141 [Trichonephila clavipes]|nr:hypothetical protein TNCV_5059141 [Trichonephila clavipes]
MGVCLCIERLLHGDTLNSPQTASPLIRLVEGEKWEAPDHLLAVLAPNWDGTDPNRTITWMVLKATVNNKHTSNPLPRRISWLSI